jgi:hypothetical protein
LHVLSENFGTHEKQIITDHDPVRSSCRYLRFRAPLGTRHINRCAIIGKPVCGGVCVGGGAYSTTPTYTVRSGGPAREPSWSAFWLQKPVASTTRQWLPHMYESATRCTSALADDRQTATASTVGSSYHRRQGSSPHSRQA